MPPTARRHPGLWTAAAAALLLLLFLPCASRADPATDDASPWRRAIGPWAWQFPRDHGAHPDFKTEWWYVTGNLADAAGRKFGFELTLFRQGIQFRPVQTASRWAVRDAYFGHFAISDLAADRFHTAERISRGALDEARAATGRMDVAIGPWSIVMDDGSGAMRLAAREPDMEIGLTARPLKPLVLEGVNGLSRKADGAGEASYYYSYPRLATSGRLRVGGQAFEVSGQSWFDHEFSTSSLGENEAGWDWFCLQLGNGEELMLYAMRDKSGAMDPVSEGTWVRADGTSRRLPPGSFSITRLGTWRSPKSGAAYPAGWHILVPGHGADLTISPAMADQELHLTRMSALDYWEGACTIGGSVAGRPVAGTGYTELTGYARPLREGMTE